MSPSRLNDKDCKSGSFFLPTSPQKKSPLIGKNFHLLLWHKQKTKRRKGNLSAAVKRRKRYKSRKISSTGFTSSWFIPGGQADESCGAKKKAILTEKHSHYNECPVKTSLAISFKVF